MAAQTPTPSSEIIHLTTTYVDALESLPPALTRSLSDLKELDAVLSGSLSGIGDKLRLLNEMMHTPEPGSKETAEPPKYTPLDRLKLLREVAEDARLFRLGGEDKIRVATNTCETIATHTSHLATLSTLLLSFLPTHLLPHLPAPSAPHGYPSSNTPASAIARRQLFDYPPARHPGQGSTSRLSGALNMVREHYDMTRGAGRGYGAGGAAAAGKKRAAPIDYSIYGDDYPAVGSSSLGRKDKERDPALRHPNQYTKKRMQGYAGGGPGGAQAVGGGYGGAVSAATTNAAAGLYSSIPSHPLGMTAVEAVKEKRRGADPVAPAMSTSGNGSRAGSVVSGVQGNAMAYQGVQGETDYHMLAYGVPQRAPAKRKVEDVAGASKRRKKGIDNSPDPAARTLAGNVAAASRVPRRQGSTRLDEPLSPVHVVPMEDEYEAALAEAEDDGDKTLYCFCQRVSFGEMIACDAPDCEHEWFHLPCVGLKSIPDGRWFCDECRRNAKSGKKRR
ncbi:hypothetical protein NBRC10512_001630 [Rhodotorula toruloides]|uniref:Chromatin modification-related protein n=2 Tax=Rhodotorula toruloides TaxID=5286 RepID=A0A061B998_RHOTO|nr:chromatin modification-related protein YNG2 [Rhodotorula toruloides NP11]EMS23113.1 chromatin modification-related protein YNG2 [Rhodotorula toruloides NP11]KAJ8291660.1 Chromatin modification-related protein YNG2 [Rhodotorula toruloides]CDR46495.1 RHTO0S12e05138g1_1 [Rhodotorula toruloides]